MKGNTIMKKNIAAVAALIAAASLLSAAHAQTPETSAPAASQASEAAHSAGQTVSGWFDKLSNSVKKIGEKSSEYADEAQNYTTQLKDQWPSIKEKFSQGWQESMQKGSEGKEAIQKWMNDTFSKERMDKAESWLADFKNGVEDKVVDPLVPYILTIRYPNPMDEWNQGYKRLFPVQVQGFEQPVELTLPLSWNLSQDLSLGQNEFMSFRSESGSGKYVVALITTPTGSTVDSLVAGLQKNRADAVTEKLPDTQIVRVTYPAVNDKDNAVYYYAIPVDGKAMLLCGEVLRSNGQSTQQLNEALAAQSDFFNAVAKNVFVKPAN